MVLPILVAAALRLFQLARPNALFGITEYDDGVYVGETLRWVGGALPYKDFVVVHPPAILYLLAPLAVLHHVIGTDGVLAAARVLTVLVDVANVALVGVLLRHGSRSGRFASMAFLAVYPGALAASHTVLLEPFLDFFCLLGAVALFRSGAFASRRRILLGGALFGVAAAVKIFALVPIIIVIAILLVRRRREIGAFVIGVAGALLVTVGPFLMSTPGAFTHQVLVDQLVRSSPVRTPSWLRISYLDGIYYFFTSPTSVWNPSSGLPIFALDVVGLASVVGVVAAAWTVIRRTGAAIEDVGLFATGCLALTVLAFWWTGLFWYHYAAFSGTFVALIIGLTRVPARWVQVVRSVGRWAIPAALAGLVILEATVIGGSRGAPAPAVLRSLPARSCVVADEAALTIASGTFRSVPGCPAMVDSDGSTLAWDGGREAVGVRGQEAQLAVDARWEALFGRADYLVLSAAVHRTIPMDPAVTEYLVSHFHILARLPDGEGTLYQANRRD